MSLIDYPKKIAAIVFTIGCNFRCHFCYNIEIVDLKSIKGIQKLKEKDFFDFLKARIGKLDAVCVTGGEPTLQVDLVKFITKIKKLGFLVKLDTNGTNPKVLDELLQKKLIDYVAMDLKSEINDDKYQSIVHTKIDISNIKKSIKLLMNSAIGYEFRTTCAPKVTKKDLINIAKFIKGAPLYYLQVFKDKKVLDPKYLKNKWLSESDLDEVAKKCEKYVKVCKVR